MQHYRYALEMANERGDVLGRVPLEPDFEPAIEWARFQFLRELSRTEVPTTATARPVIEPVWDPGHPPYLSGFCAVIPQSPGASAAVRCEFPTTSLYWDAYRLSRSFVDRGQLKPGEPFEYRILAARVAGAAPGALRGGGIVVEEVERPPELTTRTLQPLTLVSEAHDARDPAGAGDLPVFVPQHVLDQATALARRAGDVEIGGVLVGRLCRDPESGALFVEITAQIPARHTVANATRLTFTPETWADIDAVVRLRARGELKVSWWHYHPNFCRRCPQTARQRCTYSRVFFSAEDVHLHRTCFGRAFNVAFLISDVPDRGLVWSCFGWRQGLVAARSFHVTHADHERRDSPIDARGAAVDSTAAPAVRGSR